MIVFDWFPSSTKRLADKTILDFEMFKKRTRTRMTKK
jgi:hypothetical protein